MPRNDKITICVFVDALGWEMLRRNRFLDDTLLTRAPLGTVFGYSSTCCPTIITGLLPRDHGHFSFFYYNPRQSPFGGCRFLAALPDFITRRGRVRRVIARSIRLMRGYTGYFQIYNMPFRYLPLFDYSEKRDIYAPGGINSGAPTIFDHLRKEGVPFHMSDWRKPEETNVASLRRALERAEARFAYLYLAGLDGVAHVHGPRSSAVDRKMRGYETTLRRLLDLAHRNYTRTEIHVFSDHGMTDVTDTCDLMARVNATGLVFGKDFAACYDSTMARFWLLSPGAREKIVAALRREPKGEILPDERLAEYGCDFPDRRYGELFFLLKPGVMLCPSFMGVKPMAGMHGYDPYHKDSVAAFASSVSPDPAPARLDDLCGLMREL